MARRAPDTLQAYRAKRDFNATPEPARGGRPNEQARAFVVQKHWASRLHYDFRLEWQGAMKSWAVPKGPSLDPADKRMAVQTEDHPIAYNQFEGTIPEGHYGAGKVIIWDKGTWTPLEDADKAWRAGKIKFELHGHKLRGYWMLVRIKGRRGEKQAPWLLIKERDDQARPQAEYSVIDQAPDSVAGAPDPEPGPAGPPQAPPAPVQAAASGPPAGAVAAALPATLRPQLATLVDAVPGETGQWLYEVKFDGYRMLARVARGAPQLFTRNGHDWTHKLPELAKALAAMDLPDGWYDGEIVMPGERKPTDFQALQNAFDSGRTGQIVYYLFDLPYCAGQDLRAVPLEARREVLARIVARAPQPRVRLSQEFDAAPADLVASACRLGLEGLIGKRRGSRYVQRRSNDWIKLKCGQRQEFVIAGFTAPQGSRQGLGALLLAVHDAQGRLRHAGNVGTGFDARALLALRAQLEALVRTTSPLADRTPLPRGAQWVEPRLVAEVAFGEWTREGKVRHAVFQGLREDKPARAIGREKAAKRAPAAKTATKNVASPAELAGLPVKVSNPERVIDPDSGTTKLQLVRYYALVAPLMMEHVAGRPVALVRAPDGVGGELFFQKHAALRPIAGFEQLPKRLDPGHAPLVAVAQPAGLAAAAQMNAIEFHTWNAMKDAIATPDRMTFDLDPGEGVGWAQVREAAQLVHAFLNELALPSFVKTSGGKGLHIVVPLEPVLGWDEVKDFSHAVVQHLARTLPDRFVAKSGPKNRVGRIFIDYLRNGFGATTVAAWSARARPGLGISVPLAWDELPKLKSAAQWTVGNVHERLDQGNAPWTDYARRRVRLDAAMRRLAQAG